MVAIEEHAATIATIDRAAQGQNILIRWGPYNLDYNTSTMT